MTKRLDQDSQRIISVPLCVRSGGRWMTHETVDVTAYETVCPYLLVHPTVDRYASKFTLTHELTGSFVARTETLKAALLIAGAVNHLIDWSFNRREKIKAQLDFLDPKLAAWVRGLRYPVEIDQ